jgi:hypothetical protein
MAKDKVWVFAVDQKEAVGLAEMGCGYDSIENATAGAGIAGAIFPRHKAKLFEVQIDIRVTRITEVQPK